MRPSSRPSDLNDFSEEWWAETLRRYDEAEKRPERLLDADTFFSQVRDEIAEAKRLCGDTSTSSTPSQPKADPS